MHYVTGGRGTPVVLIHGWPQTWYGWWAIMPELAEHQRRRGRPGLQKFMQEMAEGLARRAEEFRGD
ncbi:hypothetical protein GCM10010330_24840 [Streptomyces tendae]|uniref:alpha/beta fold hydrolase n=1 Tax=Streptomyces tendae TaxID=1932 RepID=UPI001988A0A3|nr:hypothetical protein [Streptomyces tendae]GHA71093.1 hypothetical protein GCM10010330_24840 [Streptomyces tendae]